MKINLEKITSGKTDSYISKKYEEEDFSSPRHYHEEFELILIEESHGRLFAGNNIISFKKGDLFLFAPNMVHCFKNEKQRKIKAKASIILFKKDFLGREFMMRKEATLLDNLLMKAEKGIQFFNPKPHLILSIKHAINKEGLLGVTSLIEALDQLSKYKYYKLISENRPEKYYYTLRNDKISAILNYVEKHYASPDIFASLLKITKLSGPSFSRFFKHKTGKTFTEYLNEVKISNVQKLLIETNGSIAEIAVSCGYRNQVYFNRTFKKTNGITPRFFRKNFVHT